MSRTEPGHRLLRTLWGLIRWPLPRSIQGTLLLLVVITLAPVLLAQGGIHFSTFQQLEARRVQETQDNIELARVVAAIFDDFVRDVRHDEAEVGVILTADPPVSSEQARRVLALHANEHPAIYQYLWADQNGRVIGASDPLFLGLDIGQHPYFFGIRDGREWAVSDLFQEDLSSREVFAIARGIRQEGGALRGVAVALIDARRLGEVLMVQPAGQDAISLIDSQGFGVYRYPETEMAWERRNWIATQPIIAKALAGEEVSGTFISVLDGGERTAGMVPIPSIGWVASANRPMEETLAPVIQDIFRDSVVILFVAVLAALIARIISAKITGPLERLQVYAAAIGRSEFGHRAEFRGPTELKQLAVAFNRMADEIRKRQVRLEESVAELRRVGRDLRQERDFTSAIVDTAGSLVMVLDRQGQIVRFNHACERISGYSLDEVFGKVAWDLLSVPEERESVSSVLEMAKAGSFSNELEHCLVTRDGRLRTIAWTSTLLLDEVGEPEYVIVTGIDITERKRAEEDLKQSLETLQRTLDETIQAMALVVEMRDLYTAGHQRRVADLAYAIAKEMGFSEGQSHVVRLAAAVHDIGKISVPSEILSKPGRIGVMEFTLIKQHSQVGYDILKTIEFPWPIAQIVLQHHERMDGSGYPSRLSGEAILREARIVAVADVVEAMASHRPYRPALGIDEALAEIARNSGLLYDREVVDACLELFASKRYRLDEGMKVALASGRPN